MSERELPATRAPEAGDAARKGGWLRGVALLLLALATFAGAGLATFAYHALTSKVPPASETVTSVRPTASILTAVRDLATLEAASFHMERVIDLRDTQRHMFGLFESQDAVLLVAAADVVAGVDLSTMRDGDIRFDRERRSAQVMLPPPVVLSARLDNERTYVHKRSTDALAVRAETLETRARIEAERTLRDAAIESGLLQRARSNAARTVKTLVESLGYDYVEVTFREE